MKITMYGLPVDSQMPTTQCVAVAALRKTYPNQDIDLEKWTNMPDTLLVTRRGRVFIHYTDEQGEKQKKVFTYPDSKWRNPYVIGDGPGKCSLEECLRKYRQHIIDSGLLVEIKELKGKTLGCFCDQKGPCHAKVLVELYNESVKE